MKLYLTLILSLCITGITSSQIPSKDDQINATVKTLPEELQSGAKVLGYSEDGSLVTLREGTNDMICLADDPGKDGYNAACYHKDLEEFMARGRELRSEGKNHDEIFQIREEEAKAGKLNMPEQPTTLHICYGSDGKYNAESGEVENTNIRYVVYIPWATPESSGLPIKPMMPGGPWIMDPGTHRAHIMITPPNN